jgi:hypothetical protein
MQTLKLDKPQNNITYLELRDKLLKIERTLTDLAKKPDRHQTKAETKLKVLKENYMKQLRNLREQNQGTVMTDKPEEAEKLAKRGVNVQLTKEQQMLGFTDEVITKLENDLKDTLRALGSEISSISSTKKNPTAIDIVVEFNNKSKTTYSALLENTTLVIKLEDMEGDVRIPVNILPSGELQYNSELLKKEYIKFMEREVMDFQDLDSELDAAYDANGALLEVGDIVSIKQHRFKISFDSAKKLVYLESQQGKRVYGNDKKFKILLEASTRESSEDEDTEFEAILAKLRDLEQDQKDSHTKNYDDEEMGIIAENAGEVEVGDKVVISKEYGGARGKVVTKRGSFIVLDNGESYHESDVVKIRRDVQEDLHVGHQDDEPGMLAQTAYELATYAADIHKMLKFYESLDQNVNFPNWWQSKVILARDYVSKAAHWLEYTTRELDQTQSYLNEKRKCKYDK